MKKIIVLILSAMMTISLCSCSSSIKQNKYVETAEKYGVYSIFNVTYGMSLEECIKELSVDKKDIKMINADELEDDYKNLDVQAFSSNLKLFNKDVIAYFYIFGDLTKTGNEIGLFDITVVFKDNISINDIVKELENDLETKKLSYKLDNTDSKQINFINNNSISTITDEAVKQKAKTLANTMYGNMYKEPFSADKFPLDNINIISMDEKNLYRICFSGRLSSVVNISANKDI